MLFCPFQEKPEEHSVILFKGGGFMPYTGHVRKRTTKSGITTYQVIVEEESSFANGKRKRYYKTIQGGKKQAEKVIINTTLTGIKSPKIPAIN